MKVATFGFHGPTDQISRIEQGFVENGWKISNDNPDLIYANNALYDEALQFSIKWPHAKKIFTVLDIPHHAPNYPFYVLKQQLLEADAVCSISKTVQQDLLETFNIYSDVIYQPAKPVYKIEDRKYLKEYMGLYVGRANDELKRFNIVKELFQKLHFEEKQLVVVGSENPGFGDYRGIVSDEELNYLYNNSFFVFLPSKSEGLGLSAVESVITETSFVVCNDNPTAIELYGNLCIEPNVEAIINRIRKTTWHTEMKKFLKENSEKFKNQFAPRQVAASIINCYNKL